MSSMIASFNYNEEEKILTVTFNKGGTYEYEDVPKQVYIDMNEAESKGKYFLANIKNKYKTEKI